MLSRWILKLSLVVLGLITLTSLANKAFKSSKLVVNKNRLIELIGEIGSSEIEVAQGLHELTQDSPPAPIYLLINSPGGSVMFGMMLVDAIEEAKMRGNEIHCAVGSVAASMAFQLLAHCDYRYALRNAQLLFHSVSVFGLNRLTPVEAQYMSERLKEIDKKLDEDLLNYLPMKKDLYEYNKKNETFWTAKELNTVLKETWITEIDEVDGVKSLFTFLKPRLFFLTGEILSIPSMYIRGEN